MITMMNKPDSFSFPKKCYISLKYLHGPEIIRTFAASKEKRSAHSSVGRAQHF